jgi:dTDP-4-amino-4,6-dideoxy-D-galactose acyltransferase
VIIPLSFDSELFGYPVGKIEVDHTWEESEFLNDAAEFTVVYIFSKSPLSIQDTRIRLVDEKLVFQKFLSSIRNSSTICQYEQQELLPALVELALLSGVFSRYKTDTRLNHNEFEKLYSVWIKNALEQGLVLTDPNLNGMITLTSANLEASIGLFAVAEGQRGTGLGTELIQATEQKAFQAGAKTLMIPTQATNIPACQLYEKLGYEVVDRSFVYHYLSPFQYQASFDA